MSNEIATSNKYDMQQELRALREENKWQYERIRALESALTAGKREQTGRTYTRIAANDTRIIPTNAT